MEPTVNIGISSIQYVCMDASNIMLCCRKITKFEIIIYKTNQSRRRSQWSCISVFWCAWRWFVLHIPFTLISHVLCIHVLALVSLKQPDLWDECVNFPGYNQQVTVVCRHENAMQMFENISGYIPGKVRVRGGSYLAWMTVAANDNNLPDQMENGLKYYAPCLVD